MKNLILFIFSMGLLTAGCRKKPDPVKPVIQQPEKKTSISFTFKNVVGNELLSLEDTWYRNENGDSIRLSSYKYYVTNFVLVKGDSEYVVPESYYLIDESNPQSKTFTFEGIPAGDYDKIKFMIGVDVARNTSGAQTGALDPIHGMFWDWSTGYIMAKMEGWSPQSGTKQFFYHAGGFKLGKGAQRDVVLELPKKATVIPSYYPHIIIRSDVMEWFKTPTTISIASMNAVMSDLTEVKTIADNYANMFTVEDVMTAVE
ncbi:MAG TPA: MbnP family protein [Flavipsychrobacter sp.]|nr:MbnP family protein [Flavipsychrobacter sp.]